MLNPRIRDSKFHSMAHEFLLFVVFFVLVLGISNNAGAANLDLAKVHFLKGNYEATIDDCHNILKANPKTDEAAEVYYFLGLSYFMTQDLQGAKDAFGPLLANYKNTQFGQQALLSMGAIYSQLGDFTSASGVFESFLRQYPGSDLSSAAYFGLAKSLLKQGKWQAAKEDLLKIQQDYPLSFEANLAKNMLTDEFYFTVQVGSFSNSQNAQNLCRKLRDKGLDCFIQQEDLSGATFYRVRVGKFSSRQEAEDLGQKLSQQGYPTKIFP